MLKLGLAATNRKINAKQRAIAALPAWRARATAWVTSGLDAAMQRLNNREATFEEATVTDDGTEKVAQIVANYDPTRPALPHPGACRADGRRVNGCVDETDRYLAAAGNPHIRLFEVNTQNLQPVTSYDGHQGNVTAVGFERDGRWMYSGSDDGTVKIWDLRAGGYQREYESRGAVTVSLFYFIWAIRLTSCFVHHSAACYTRTARSSSAGTRTATCACGTSHRTRARASSYRRLASRCAA